MYGSRKGRKGKAHVTKLEERKGMSGQSLAKEMLGYSIIPKTRINFHELSIDICHEWWEIPLNHNGKGYRYNIFEVKGLQSPDDIDRHGKTCKVCSHSFIRKAKGSLNYWMQKKHKKQHGMGREIEAYNL